LQVSLRISKCCCPSYFSINPSMPFLFLRSQLRIQILHFVQIRKVKLRLSIVTENHSHKSLFYPNL
jgi:hypothetical protein